MEVLVSSFLLNFFWEVLQTRYYMHSVLSFNQHFPMLIVASILDIFWMLILFYIGVSWFSKKEWIVNKGVSKYFFAFICGIFLGAIVEFFSVNVLRLWSYGLSMPIIPFFNIGIFPVMQFGVISLVIIFVMNIFFE